MNQIYKNESALIGQIIKTLQSTNKLFAYRINNAPTRGRRMQNGQIKGVPDIQCMILNPKNMPFIFIEAKMPGEDLSPDQQLFKEKAIQAGHAFITAYCVEDIIHLIR